MLCKLYLFSTRATHFVQCGIRHGGKITSRKRRRKIIKRAIRNIEHAALALSSRGKMEKNVITFRSWCAHTDVSDTFHYNQILGHISLLSILEIFLFL